MHITQRFHIQELLWVLECQTFLLLLLLSHFSHVRLCATP